MPLTPAEAMAKNEGREQPQFDRAMDDLYAGVELAIEDYVGESLYVGLPAYLQYRVEADRAKQPVPVTLRIIDRLLHERFSSSGWKMAIVTNESQSYWWAKLVDAEHH